MELDIKTSLAKYQAERDNAIAQLQQIETQRNQLIAAIQERNGVLAFLTELSNDGKAKG